MVTFWKDKGGNKLTFKEFMQRWKQGVEGITPLQQTKMQYKATWIMIIGIFCGLVITGMSFKRLWWLFIVLLGALFNTGVQLIGIYQKIRALKQLEQFTMPEGEETEDPGMYEIADGKDGEEMVQTAEEIIEEIDKTMKIEETNRLSSEKNLEKDPDKDLEKESTIQNGGQNNELNEK